MKNAATTVAKLVEVALRRWSMIEAGDRILLGASGGKDSTALALDLAAKRRWWPVHFELAALHIATDVGTRHELGPIRARYEDAGIEWTELEVPVIGRLKAGERMNCYWCSTQRRTELIRYALANGFNKIALGHHLDDIVETLVMNMLHKAEISTMPPVVRYAKYPLSVIRPLALVEERQIVACARELGFDAFTCTCGYDGASRRKEVREKIAALTEGSSKLKRNLFDSMSKVNVEYLVGRGSAEGEAGV
ncbi:MAG: tRNA 2-thiocytidine biosynthesis protein TtcA [Spirochaetales bacterium]|nr:tRNA 2-thiocytidine biosynthesis protein TtcA [Spirochaetales bacterium]